MTNGRSPTQIDPLGVVHQLAEAQVIQASPAADGQAVAATRFRFRQLGVNLPALGAPAIGINYGKQMKLTRLMYGRRVSGYGSAGHLLFGKLQHGCAGVSARSPFGNSDVSMTFVLARLPRRWSWIVADVRFRFFM